VKGERVQHAQDFLTEVAEDLAFLPARDRYVALREYGDELPPMDAALKVDANMVPGCLSLTYLAGSLDEDGLMRFQGDSESFVSKGYLYILVEAFDGCRPEALVKDAEPLVNAFAEKAQVALSMVPSRANVFERMFRFMQRKAVEALADAGDTTA
jgi:cysteine desulfuration protein SufE